MHTAFDPALATFAEADPDRPRRRLTRAQVEAFNQHGLLSPLPGFDAAGAAANRTVFDRLLAEFSARGHDSYAINGYHLSCASVWDVVVHPILVDYAVDLLGDDVVAWGAHYFCKLPGDGKTVAWHQDAPYWALNPTRTITVWLAIDDVDLDNAAMRLIPGSHRLGALRMRDSTPEENNVLWLSLDGAEDLAAPQAAVLRAGECSLHSDLTVHGSPANTSSRRRAGLAIRYAHTSVRSPENWNDRAIIVAGSDPSGHWKHSPRPDGDKPFPD